MSAIAPPISTSSPPAPARRGRMSREEVKVIAASSAGTIFEWYDFYLYGSLAVIIGAQFFSQYPEATRNVFALLAFAAGFLVRPFGALVFGRLGDLIGRKYTFLITIVIMGLSTFLVGILPGSETIGWLAPVALIALAHGCRVSRSAASTAVRRSTSPSTRRRTGAASTPRSSRPRRRWVCCCRWW